MNHGCEAKRVEGSKSLEMIVVGAGASGLMAAITAARCGAKVTVLEQKPKGGSKLLVTGNGRCNMTCLDPELPSRYQSSNPGALKNIVDHVLSAFSVPDTLDFFREEGLLVQNRQDYVYPRSGQAASVLDTLLRAAFRAGVRFRYNTRVKDIRRDTGTGRFRVSVEGYVYTCDRVILSTGSRAWYPKEEALAGYRIAEKTGHRIVPVLPSLTALCVKEPEISLAAGARTDAVISLLIHAGKGDTGKMSRLGKPERGELQWTKDALSGIAVFQLSGLSSRALAHKERVIACVDLLPDMEEEEVGAFIAGQISKIRSEWSGSSEYLQMSAKKDAGDILSGMVHKRTADMILNRCRLKGIPAVTLSQKQIEHLADTVKHCTFHVDHVRGFDKAQTCCGGVALEEIQPETLESTKCPGLYFTGELLDIDGPCGGYNLQWAWSSGVAAGMAATH